MLREFYIYLSSCHGKQSNFSSLGHANHINIYALFTVGGLEPNVYILGPVSFGMGTTSEHILSPFTSAICSSREG